jgi:predicted N-formylglutamate amidohydrolase
MQDGLGSEQAGMALVEDSYEILPVKPRAGQTRGATPGLILLCDHAGNAFPPDYGTLGLLPSELERHIAYDIGAAGIVRAMSARLDAPAVLSRYSRLLIDLNRGADDPTLIMRLSDGAIVPGNHHIDETEWDKRIGLYYEPYHAAVDSVIARTQRQGVTPVIVSIHSPGTRASCGTATIGSPRG